MTEEGKTTVTLSSFITQEKIDNWFTYHKPHGNQGVKYDAIRSAGHELATIMFGMCPGSPELSTAISHLRSAIHWANAAIACNEK